MATIEQESQSRNELKKFLAGLASLDPAQLARQDLGTALSFESGVIFFSRTLRLFRTLNDCDLEDVPFAKLEELKSVASAAVQILHQIRDFTLQQYQSNPINTRNQFIDQVRDGYDSAFQIASPVIAYAIRKGTDFQRLEEQARAAIRRIDETSAEHERALQDTRATAEQVLQEVRRVAEEAGVSQHAVHFKKEAEGHDISAKGWLSATIWLGLATFLFGIVMLIVFFANLASLTPQQSLQLAISKIVVFSVMLSAALWSGKIYRAHRHNVVVNRHRQNALTTFQTFAKAAGDEQTKNTVLLQATQCIFGPQQTGYVSGDADGPAIPQVLEIFRNLGKVG